jgi:Ca2+-transporting ATPase
MDRMNLLSNLWDNRGFVIVIGIIFIVQIVFTEIGGSMLRTVPLTTYEFIVVLFMASLIIPFDLLRKFVTLRCRHAKLARKARH